MGAGLGQMQVCYLQVVPAVTIALVVENQVADEFLGRSRQPNPVPVLMLGPEFRSNDLGVLFHNERPSL